ncbi:MAG: three-Cys-motif partner protein TcmP [Methylophilaceae bacterium]
MVSKKKTVNKGASLFENEDENEEMSHEFGGAWTQEKLAYLKKYLQSFTTVFKNAGWAKTIYIDAYAGSGICDIRTDKGKVSIPGSAKLALDTEPVFDEVVFIEKNKDRYEQLVKLKNTFPHANLNIHRGDCNELLPDVLSKLKNNYRGVIFVDPYGMNISWDIMKAIATTTKLDVWYLFPLSGLYRQATINKKDVTKDKQEAIERLLGSDSNWENELYEKRVTQGFFGSTEELIRTQDMDKIVAFVTNRLKTIFPYVSEPKILPNKGIRRFAFYFAISNESDKAQEIAKNISSYILNSTG